VSTEGGTKAVLAALVANLGIAASKFVAYLLTGSSSMLSEAIHSVADSANQVLLLIGGKRSQRAADATHQFGYSRVRYVYAFVVSIILFLVGGIFSLYEGFHKFTHPEELRDVGIAIGVLLIAIALEAFSFRTAMREADKSRSSRSLFQFVRDARQPELPVVLLEDSGALIGLVFALVGVGMATVTGDARWDGLGAMAVGTLLVVIAVFLAFEMASMLVGESALPEQDAAIRSALEDADLVDRVIHLKTLHVGPDELLVAAKVAIPGDDDAATIAAGIDAAEAAIRSVVPTARYIYLEPDLDRSRRRPAVDPAADSGAADG
jgi:cation diffusion facilitator family transporter